MDSDELREEEVIRMSFARRSARACTFPLACAALTCAALACAAALIMAQQSAHATTVGELREYCRAVVEKATTVSAARK